MKNINQTYNKVVLMVALAAILLMPNVIFAESNTKLTREQKISANKVRIEQKIDKLNKKTLNKWQKLGSQKIRKNINRLNRLISMTNAATNLAADVREGIINDINNDIANENTLKAKITAETDLTTLKNEVKSIATVGSINAKYLPRIN
ncbi:MAG: hypothetical protein WCP93_03560 [Candidatus Berkelbacteria bacterium]